MAQENRKTRFPGIADAVCRSRFSPYLFSFLLAFCGLIAVFLLARDAGAYLSETQAAEWYGLLSSLGRGDALAALSESKDLALLSFAYDPINRILSLFSFSSLIWGVCLMNAIRCGLAAAAFA